MLKGIYVCGVCCCYWYFFFLFLLLLLKNILLIILLRKLLCDVIKMFEMLFAGGHSGEHVSFYVRASWLAIPTPQLSSLTLMSLPR